jgi:metallophosphoesterase superfamily enzyme
VLDAVFRDRAVFFPDAEVLVVADLHVGRADASEVQFPLGERADLTERLEWLVEHFDPERVVVAGDVLHSFGHVSRRATETLADIRNLCRAGDARLVLVGGNHDGMLPTAWDGTVQDAYVLDGGSDDPVLICHGHEEPAVGGGNGSGDAGAGGGDDPALYVAGHDHPAITIEGQKRPCFLSGEGVYRGADLLMLPAFSRVASGVAVNGMRARDFQSPLVRDADALRPIVWDPSNEEALRFPPLGRFRRML